MSSAWNTIESDAGVFTELIEKIGVKGVEFEELLSIDPDSLRQVQPLYGVVFLFKYRASQYREAAKNGPVDGEYSQDDTVFFAQQQIQNACATQAVLNMLMNKSDTVDIGDTLGEFKSFTEAFDPELRGEAMSNSDAIRLVHNSFSRPAPFGADEQDDKPDKDEENDGLYHFIAYLPVNGQLLELDGLYPQPIAHGPCEEGDFPEKLSEVLQNRVSRGPVGEMRFNLIALTCDKREVYKQAGDTAALRQEEAKRKAWHRENLLRRENFVGLIYDLVKGATAGMTDAEFEKRIENGRQATEQKIQQQQMGK